MPAGDRVIVGVDYRMDNATSGLDIGVPSFSPARFPEVQEDIHLVGGRVIINATDIVSVNGLFGKVVKGRNTASSNVFGVSLGSPSTPSDPFIFPAQLITSACLASRRARFSRRLIPCCAARWELPDAMPAGCRGYRPDSSESHGSAWAHLSRPGPTADAQRRENAMRGGTRQRVPRPGYAGVVGKVGSCPIGRSLGVEVFRDHFTPQETT